MDGMPELLGNSLGTMLGNPTILIAGLLVARRSPPTGKFWLELLTAIIVCTAIQFSFDKGVSDLPSDRTLAGWLPLVALATIWATIVFMAVRKIRSAFRSPQGV